MSYIYTYKDDAQRTVSLFNLTGYLLMGKS
jgi:hypothetical protein